METNVSETPNVIQVKADVYCAFCRRHQGHLNKADTMIMGESLGAAICTPCIAKCLEAVVASGRVPATESEATLSRTEEKSDV